MSSIQQPSNAGLRAEFFKLGNKTMISIQYAGDAGNVYEGKVTPEHVKNFPREWEAFQNGQDLPPVVGTPLTEIPGFTVELQRFYQLKGIHVCEQLAEASDSVCQGLGMGARQFRKSAQLVVDSVKLHKLQAAQEAAYHANVKPAEPRVPVDDDDVEVPDINEPVEDKPRRPVRRRR